MVLRRTGERRRGSTMQQNRWISSNAWPRARDFLRDGRLRNCVNHGLLVPARAGTNF
jgi:hypothetical protein